MKQRLDSLVEIEAEIWAELSSASIDKQHEWRTMVLATVDGHAADARTVILREMSARDRQLQFYTDQRAGKVAQLMSHPRGTLVMWSPRLGWQLRCKVLLSAEMSGLAADSRWARIKLTPAAQDYLAEFAPGALLAAADARPAAPPNAAALATMPASYAPASSIPAPSMPAASTGASPPLRAAPRVAAHAHFAVINAQVLAIDWLELHRQGHRRAVIDDEGARWVQP